MTNDQKSIIKSFHLESFQRKKNAHFSTADKVKWFAFFTFDVSNNSSVFYIGSSAQETYI